MSVAEHSCWRCGWTFTYPLEEATFPCPACGTILGRPKSEGESLTWLRSANRERSNGQFAEAEAYYRQVLGRHPDEHEAMWGLVMCKHGVEVLEGRPTVRILQRQNILDDPDYARACQLAPSEVREGYQRIARYVSQVQKSIPPMDEQGYDVFLCYRSDDKRAREYQHALELYADLKAQGYRVFFAERMLNKNLGAQYEAQIFHALYSARVMLLICSDPKNLSTTWVSSEWRRFIQRFYQEGDCRLIPMLYDGCNPYEMPGELQRLEALVVGQNKWWNDLLDNLQRFIRPQKKAQPGDSLSVNRLVFNAQYSLENGDWSNAASIAGSLREKYSDRAEGYILCLLAKMKAHTLEELAQCTKPFENEPDWRWAMKQGTEEQQAELTRVLKASQELRAREAEERRRAEEARKRREAREAEERRRAEEERKRREAREAEERRRAEEERKAREAREAEERRRAEEERKAREAREAEELRRAEEERKAREAREAEERRQIEKAQREKALREAQERRRAEEARFEREAEAERRREQRRRRMLLLGQALPMLALVLLQIFLPAHMGVIALGVEVVAFVLLIVYDVKGTDGDFIVLYTILGLLGAAALALSLILALPAWAGVIAALLLALALFVCHVLAGMEEASELIAGAGLPMLWLVLYLICCLLLQFFTPVWLMIVTQVVAWGLGAAALIFSALLMREDDEEEAFSFIMAVTTVVILLPVAAVLLALLAASSLGVGLALHFWPEWSGVIVLGGALLTLALLSIFRLTRDESGGKTLALSLLLGGAAAAAACFLTLPEIVWYVAAAIVTVIALFSLSGEGVMFTLPVLWTLLHCGLCIALLYAAAPWMGVAMNILHWWLSGPFALVTLVLCFKSYVEG